MNLDINKIARTSKSETRKLTQEPPKVEKINRNEVYLLDDKNRRVMRICGFDQDGWACTIHAGKGTLHYGEGRCRKHDFTYAGESNYLKRYMKIISDESKLKEYFEIIESSKEDYNDTERLIKVLEGLLMNILNEYQYSMSASDIKRVVALIDQMRKLIETNIKKERNKVLALGLATWIRGVLEIVQGAVSMERFRTIKDQIMEVPLPKEIEDIEFVEET